MDRNQMKALFQREFGGMPEVWAAAPGRVNILGEHTDYNDGFVFPAAIDRRVVMAASRRDDHRVRVYSVNYDQRSEWPTEAIERSTDASWSNYLRGVMVEFQKRGYDLPGMDLVAFGDVPLGAGLSSSAAVEVATAQAIQGVAGIGLDPVETALLCQAAENRFVGVNCGIMDQFVSVLAKENHALFIDCRDLSYQPVPLQDDVSIVVCDSKVERRLDSSAYNQRRSECAEAVEMLSRHLGPIRALRDVTIEQVIEHRDRMSEVVFGRARHVVSENERVQRGIGLLADNDIEGFGALLYQSHESLRDDYEVSCPELDLLVELALQVEGTLGSRMTGAGFGGCTVNLVRSDRVGRFADTVSDAYRERSGRACEIYVCKASAGAHWERF